MANLVSGSFKSTNVNDGADARLLMLETSGNVIGFDAEGKAVPGQKVDIVAYIQNIEGSPVFTAIPYIGETAQTPITLKGSGNARYITGEEWNKDWNRLIVSVSLAGFTDSTTIAKVQDGSGKDGQNAIVGLLTNEAITLSADENGNIPDFSTATGEFQIYDGLTKVTEGVSFAISGQVGASGTINQNGVYNVTAMTADTATIEFKATYKGIEIVKKLSLAKSRKGQPGKNANLLYLSVSNNVIVFDANDVAFPNQRISIVAKLQNISGTATFKAIPYINATAQPEIALSGSGNDRYISGENWDKRWTSLSVTATIGGLSDQTTIYKISEVKGADGKNTIIGILTNESITISADANGNVPDFTKATGTFQIYDGIALVDPKNVTYAVQTQTGATATIGTNGVYRVTAMSADTATVVFKATYGGAERTKQLSIAKSKAGQKGEAGNGIKSTKTQYQRSTDGQTPPTGAWLDEIPVVPPGEFLWTKIEISLDDGTKSTGYSVGKMGAQGQPGEKGDPGAPGTPGNGIKSSSVTYQVSTSGTTTPTGTWVSTPPTVPQGQYLWTRTVLTFDNGQSVTAYAVSKSGIDGENGLNNDNMVFNSRFEKFNEWPQNSMGWYKTQFTQATQPETDKPTNNILKIGGDASSGSRYTFSRNIAVVPGTTIELSFDAKLSRLFTNKNIATIRMFDAEHANSSNQPNTVGGNSYINLYMDGTANAGAGVTEYDGKNTPIATANTWYRYKVRFLVPNNVTNVKMFFTVSDPNASSFLFIRDPQGVIYKDLNANTRNFALDSRFPSAKTIGETTTRRKNIQLSRPTKAGEKYTIAFDYSLISGTLTSQIQVVLADKNEAGKGNVLLNTSGNKNRLVGEITATGEADHLQIFHGVNGATTEATNYEFEKIMFNLGDKTFDYEQAPEDGFSTTNVWPNSSWNIGKGSWVFTDDQFEILEPETDKPESSILHGKPRNLSYQQAYQMPHPRFVNAGDIIHVSFDYKEKNRTKDTLLAIIRIFSEKDTANSAANALAEKPIKPSVLGWSLANNTDWVNVDYVFRSTVSGWLDILPYDNDATGNHESFYREIFVTNAGKLHGEWSPAQVDFATQIDGIPKVFVQANMPTDPSIKNGDQWWLQSGNKVTAIKVYGNGAWHDQAIDQAVLNIVQLNAVNINGSTIAGGEILQQFSFKESDTVLSEGSTQFKNGYFKMDSFGYVVDSAGTKERKAYENHYLLQGSQMTYQTINYNATDDTKVDLQANSILSGGRLFMSETNYQTNEVYAGQLTAKALSNTGWKTFRLGPLFEVKEGNPPQYKIIHQLDGSKLVKFRGQFGLKSGNMRAGATYYPFKAENNASSGENYAPAEITPDVTAFGYGATSTAEGGRLAATTSRNILLFPASDTSYCSLEAFQYIIER